MARGQRDVEKNGVRTGIEVNLVFPVVVTLYCQTLEVARVRARSLGKSMHGLDSPVASPHHSWSWQPHSS
jgi:hypothetical protein